MANFDINTNFNMLEGMNSFNNSINDFNKIFQNSLKQADNGIKFDDILNRVPNNNSKEIHPTEQFIGLDTINAQKIEMSPTAKMANDIGQGFKESITNLSEVNKKAETDLETFASGGDISIHEVMISAQKSSLAMQMAIQLRNQMLNAYNELKNIQL